MISTHIGANTYTFSLTPQLLLGAAFGLARLFIFRNEVMQSCVCVCAYYAEKLLYVYIVL